MPARAATCSHNHRGRRCALLTAGLAVAAVLALTPSAFANYMVGSSYYPDDNQANNVRVSFDGSMFTITDSVVIRHVGGECTRVDANTIQCPASAYKSFDFRLYGDDTAPNTFSYSGPPPPDPGMTSNGSPLYSFEVRGGSGDDVLAGSPGRDMLITGPGNDTLNGAAGADRLLAGDGNDTLDAGPGADQLKSGCSGLHVFTGGPGNDFLDACGDADIRFRDGERDTGTCQAGTRVVRLEVDPVDWLTGACPARGAGGSLGTAGTYSLPRQRLGTVLRRGFVVKFTCTRACRPQARLLLTRATARRLGIFYILGTGTKSLARAGSGQIVVRLLARARARLRQVSRVTVTLKLKPPGTAAASQRRITLRR